MRTLALLKPEALQSADLLADILSYVFKRDLSITALKVMFATNELLEQHYAEHKGKPYYNDLIADIVGQNIVAIVLAGNNAVFDWRDILGFYQEDKRTPGTIRGDFMQPGDKANRNFGHGSDSEYNAEREIGIFFPELIN